MKAPQPPRLDERRAAEFSAELRERAGAWIPSWGLADGEGDFGRTLVEIAARFNAEVAERLDRAGEKLQRGFLDWLGVRGKAARPARMPVVFKLADKAQAVLAQAPVRLQAAAGGASVVFETETDVRIVPGSLKVVVGADADGDAFYLPAPGLSDLEPVEPLPTQWQLKSFAPVGATKLQLDPETGLAEEMIIETGGLEYRIVKADKGIVTIDPGLTQELPVGATLRKVATFAPFDGAARNRQEHILYLGHTDLLNIEASATLEVVGAVGLGEGVEWQYWGKVDPEDEVDWQPLALAPPAEQKPDAVVLKKPKGAVEVREIGKGNSSRWIRAFRKTVTGNPFRVDEFGIRVNASVCPGYPPCPPPEETPSPEAEGMANTTPLVLDSVFFPLGKEPRQFDAFYLGSQEVFSKKGAKVQLCFELAEPTFSALSAVREGGLINTVLAGVGKDRALHLLAFDPSTGAISKFRGRDPLQPPMPLYQGQGEAGPSIALDRQPAWRLPVWSEPDLTPIPLPAGGFLVAVTAGNSVWVWREQLLDFSNSGWISFGSIPAAVPAAKDPIDGLVYLADSTARIAALRGGSLFLREWPAGAGWGRVNTVDTTVTPPAKADVTLKSIVPVLVPNTFGELITSAVDGMVGITESVDASKDKKLFRVSITGACDPIDPAAKFTAVGPVAVKPDPINSPNLVVVAAVKDVSPRQLWAYPTTGGAKSIKLDAGTEVAGNLEARLVGGTLHILATVTGDGGDRVLTWAPLATGPLAAGLESPSISGGGLEAAPTAVAGHVVVPAPGAEIFVTKFDPARRPTGSAIVASGVVLPAAIPPLAVGDRMVRSDGQTPPVPVSRLITEAGLPASGEVFYPVDADFPSGTTGLYAYDMAATLAGTFTGPNKLTLAPTDLATEQGSWLLIAGAFFTVDTLDKTSTPWKATLKSPTGGPMPTTGTYVRPIVTGGRVAPYIHLDPFGNGDWDAGQLARLPLIFPAEKPSRQRAKAFKVLNFLYDRPQVVALGEEFQPPVTVPATFLLDAAFGDWQRYLGETSTNPELSWEYSNGKAWESLDIENDATLNLKKTGAVRFTVPDDLAPSDWAGKTNHWVRARLIGGDYGQETVTVKTETLAGGITKQTVDRSPEGIRPPSVVKLYISYQLCDGVRPTFVLSQDSGSLRDQSEANRTAGAIVEVFVPLAVTLGRLSSTLAPSPVPPDCQPEDKAKAPAPSKVPPDCLPEDEGPSGSPPPGAASDSVSAVPPATGRALFIGLDAALSGAPVNLLLLVDKERDHGGFAPMAIEALVAERFLPIVASDATRAVGESGLLSLTFALDPTPRELFGFETLSWLRLAPGPRASASGWKPTLRGAYLNAVWASATETLTRELVGSSEGAPDLTLLLARPPVLHDTLELRVKEPLGEEERDQLRKGKPDRVLNDVKDLPGDWVLWDRVTDPLDEAPGARVYALDESIGQIRFGNGQHGMIPPIGLDSIVAFSYKRTEPDPTGSDSVPANAVAARDPLNLVSPVESVETVIAADQAAGGAPPEKAERVVRFGSARLRHRGRAVTVRDLEDLALQSSPDIAQARAIPRNGYVRLVIVMRGKNPLPSAAQVRELQRLLLAAGPLSLSAPKALRIGGPRIRRLRIELELRVETLDDAGRLTDDVKRRLIELFDTATGGPDKDGWPLGVSPSQDDVAFALLDAPRLAGIADVKLVEDLDHGLEQPWPGTLGPTELVRLADDPVRFQFTTVMVIR